MKWGSSTTSKHTAPSLKYVKSEIFFLFLFCVSFFTFFILIPSKNVFLYISVLTCAPSCGQVLYKHEGQTALKVLDKSKTSVSLPLPQDNGYVVLEIRSWGEGGDGAAHETIVSRDSGIEAHLRVVTCLDRREKEQSSSEISFIVEIHVTWHHCVAHLAEGRLSGGI